MDHKGRMDPKPDFDAFQTCINFKMTKKLLEIKKSGCSGDPFGNQYQQIMEKFTNLVKTMNDTSDINFTRQNFSLALLLMECCIKIYKRRVEITKHDTDTFANKIASKASDQIIEEKSRPSTFSGTASSADTPTVIQRYATEIGNPEFQASGVESLKLPVSDEVETEFFPDSSPEVTIDESITTNGIDDENDVPEPQITGKTTEFITLSDDEEPETNTIISAEQSQCHPVPIVDVEMEESTIHETSCEPNTITIQPPSIEKSNAPTLSTNETVMVTEDHTKTCLSSGRKRQKIDYGPPPSLVSCFEEWPTGEFDDPPELTPENYKKKKRLGEGIKLEDKQCKELLLSQVNSSSASDPINSEEVSLPRIKQEPNLGDDGDAITTTLSSVDPNDNYSGPEVTVKTEPTDNGYGTTEKSLVSFQDFLNSNNSGNSFTPEEEAQILNSIKELHYLSFTCELTNEELVRTFDSALKCLQGIYQNHNVAIQRHLLNRARMPPALPYTPKSNIIGKWTFANEDNNTPVNTVGIHELFSECIKERLQHHEYTGKTIMETTSERNKDESDLKMQEMVKEMQKQIVAKYSKIHLIEENTAGFFHRVRSFENRIMKVLASERSKEEFDIRKYEMEVLDDPDFEPELTAFPAQLTPLTTSPITSPSCSPNSAGERSQEDNENVCPLFSLNGLPSPSPSCESVTGENKWISLQRIFSHMTTLQSHEAARRFYAVLALLSFENLDIKFGDLTSLESNDSGKNVFGRDTQRARKIMTSRCLDVDTEDVFVCKVSSKLRTESFRENLELKSDQEITHLEHMSKNYKSQYTPPPEQGRTTTEQLHDDKLRLQIRSNIALHDKFVDGSRKKAIKAFDR